MSLDAVEFQGSFYDLNTYAAAVWKKHQKSKLCEIWSFGTAKSAVYGLVKVIWGWIFSHMGS